ncbi:hypothetical protein DM02DRAFT_520230 [Periconia macrospinosa]|uniref:Uncharacterized protein n=1 Tax=Periconia macrospinosa TaxID=97972 RepID=A0A2V1E096_9PLEO|nr:hypothetical protein DM02DRAFT_520230 [Periconia macrospinosa]
MDAPEILVHTSAPTTKRNDDIYQTIAENYLHFEPYQVHDDENISHHNQTHGSNPVPNEGPVTPTNVNERISSSFIVPDTSKDSYGSFPSQVYSAERMGVQTQWGTQVSTQEDSIPPSSRLEQLERLQSKWREEQRKKPNFESFRSFFTGTEFSTNWDEAIIDDTQLALQCMQSQVMDTLSTTSEDTQEETQEDEIVPETPRISEKPPKETWRVERSSRNEMRSSSPGEMPISSATGHLENTQLPSLVTDTSHVLPHATDRIATEDSSGISAFFDLPFEILPPPPEVTVDAPGALPSQITRFLAVIKSQNLERFKPLRTSRRLQNDERGHWMLECRSWALDVQLRFWASFGDRVRSGRIGWGVSIYRDETPLHGLGIVRVYCWGEIVEHIWILLWLCSEGRIVKSGSQWLDAGEEVIISMS